MITFDYADDFENIFKGNDRFYIENNIDKDFKKDGGKVKSNPYFKNSKVMQSNYIDHLSGEYGLGICPLTDDGTVTFGCIDVDSYSDDLMNVIKAIYSIGLPVAPCRSKSGGLHIYLFVSKPIQAKSMIKTLKAISSFFGLDRTYTGKVEFFPKQQSLGSGANGSCITIPYYNSINTKSYLWNTLLEPSPVEDAVRYFKRIRTTISDVNNILNEAELSDAPCCIQTIIISSVLGKNSGRNNFLFTCAVYLRKKYGDLFRQYLDEFNSRLSEPVSDKEISAIEASVKSHEYNYKCNDIPCSVYCNKLECSKREFGVGSDKGHFSGLEYGSIVRVLSAEPYYQWNLKINGGSGDFKLITFKDETSLMDQKFFAKLCLRYLNFVPARMKDNDWFTVLNTILPKIQEVTVDRATDTTLKAELYDAFLSYITQKRAGAGSPVHVKMQFSYKQDNKYFFLKSGFQRYMDVQRIRYTGENIRELLLSFGAKSDTLVYTNISGKVQNIPCWSKEIDDDVIEREAFYDDVIEEDASVIKDNYKQGVDDDSDAMF